MRACVFADFELPDAFSGAPTLVHGDETLALARRGDELGDERARRPVRVHGRDDRPGSSGRCTLGGPIASRPASTGGDDRRFLTEAVVLDAKRRPVCPHASATMVILDATQAADAVGRTVEGDGTRPTCRGG